MARRVYFAFHFGEDIFRVNQVRMSNVVAGPDRAGFYDHSEYLEAKKKGDAEIARLIRSKLEGTSVTVVLIGRQTAERRWVQFEIDESIRRQNGLLGVYIHHLKDINGYADPEFLMPPVPTVPAGVDFPKMMWRYDLGEFSRAIEQAGQGSDQQRRLRALYPSMFRD